MSQVKAYSSWEFCRLSNLNQNSLLPEFCGLMIKYFWVTIHPCPSTNDFLLRILKPCFFSNHFNPKGTESCLHSISDTHLQEQLKKKVWEKNSRKEIVGETDGIEISKAKPVWSIRKINIKVLVFQGLKAKEWKEVVHQKWCKRDPREKGLINRRTITLELRQGHNHCSRIDEGNMRKSPLIPEHPDLGRGWGVVGRSQTSFYCSLSWVRITVTHCPNLLAVLSYFKSAAVWYVRVVFWGLCMFS